MLARPVSGNESDSNSLIFWNEKKYLGTIQVLLFSLEYWRVYWATWNKFQNCLLTAAAKLLQSCPTLCDPIDGRQPTMLPHPWDSPGKNTGVGCHFLLQCVKSESEVAQSCPTLSDPMDCSLPGSSIHEIFQARVLEWDAIAFSVRIV